MTPEKREDLLRWLAEPLPPDIQERSDAMIALAKTFEDRARAKLAELETHMATPSGAFALDVMWDIVALEVARCQALDCGTPTIEEALAQYGLAPAIANRVVTLRTSGTN